MPDLPTQHPLGPPTISGTDITVDLMLREPTRINAMVMDLTLQRFFVDRVFTSDGGVTGGAVVHDVVTENELYTDRPVQKIAPGGEVPILTSERGEPQVALVEKYGGRTFITDEARDRNDLTALNNGVRKIANTVVKKINTVGIAALNAAISTHSRSESGNNWGNLQIGTGTADTSIFSRPEDDFAAAQAEAEENELGYSYDLLIVNPQEAAILRTLYRGRLTEVLRDFGIDEMYVTNRQTAGQAKFVASGQVGGMRIESPLQTVTYREDATERTWVQTTVRPVFYVTDPFAVLELTGLAGQ